MRNIPALGVIVGMLGLAVGLSLTATPALAQSGPTATINSPADGEVYGVGASVPTSFSCSDPDGALIISCTDSNGSTSPGLLNTTETGTFTYTVTATSDDVPPTASASITYTVVTPSPPTATINSPSDNQIFPVGLPALTSFSCSDGTYGPGIASCTDSNESTTGTGSLDTTSPGDFTYSVTAVSQDGQTNTTSLAYTVAAAPTVTINSPANGQTYRVGKSVTTSFTCSDSTYGPGIATCSDSHGSTSPGLLITSQTGTFTYTVTALSEDGQSSTTSITYTVSNSPSASPTANGKKSKPSPTPTVTSTRGGPAGSASPRASANPSPTKHAVLGASTTRSSIGRVSGPTTRFLALVGLLIVAMLGFLVFGGRWLGTSGSKARKLGGAPPRQ
jgi:hypothetical protein